MTTKPRFPLALAEVTGQSLIRLLGDSCERIEIAGSVRRRQSEVGDIELLCIPKAGEMDLFGGPVASESLLDQRCRQLIDQGFLAPRPKKLGAVTIGPLNKLLIHPATGIGVDVFATSAENWGMAMVVRTGPAEFNVRVMARFQEPGIAGHTYGGVTSEGEELQCPTEERVFELLEWDYLEPWMRMNGRFGQKGEE